MRVDRECRLPVAPVIALHLSWGMRKVAISLLGFQYKVWARSTAEEIKVRGHHSTASDD